MRVDQKELQQLITVQDFIRWGCSRFNAADLCFGHGQDNALDEATKLVLHALHLPFDMPPMYFNTRLTEGEKRDVAALLMRRIEERQPAAYLTREAWFAGMSFYVDQRVLVPRSPIAELIEQKFEPWLQVECVERILDLGTGSGCIAIACAEAFPTATVDAVDISPSALDVAITNITRYDMQRRVHAMESDLYSALSGEPYQIIISNPPYVATVDMPDLPDEYRREPTLGLEGGRDGLDTVILVLKQALDYLTPGGVLVVEVGNSESALVARFPGISFMWHEFRRGGRGVFSLTYEQLRDNRHIFANT